MAIDRQNNRALGAGLLLLSALALAGCSISIADLPLIGTPADAPSRSKDADGYLPVNDLPPERQEAMPPAERAKIESELVAARDRQASVAAAKDAAVAKDSTVGAAKDPASK